MVAWTWTVVLTVSLPVGTVVGVVVATLAATGTPTNKEPWPRGTFGMGLPDESKDCRDQRVSPLRQACRVERAEVDRGQQRRDTRRQRHRR